MKLATVVLVLMLAMSAFLIRSAPSADAGVLNPSTTYRLPCTAENMVISYAPDGVFSGGGMWITNQGTLWGMATDDCEIRSYFKFDYASLPAGLAIQQAKLWFYVEMVATIWDLDWDPAWHMSPYDPLEFSAWWTSADWDPLTLNWTNQPYTITDYHDCIGSSALPRISPMGESGNSTANTTKWQSFYTWYSLDITYQSGLWYSGTPNWGCLFRVDTHMGNNSYVVISGPNSPPVVNRYSDPYVEITAVSEICQVHLSYYDAFTGEGIAPWSFNVSARIENATLLRIVPELTTGLYNQNLTVVVHDFFGNELYNHTNLINAADFYWDIGLPVYSYKFYNQNPVFALLRIHYNMVGAPYSEFIPPYDYVGRYLKAGTYRFNITFYNESGTVGNTYTWVRTIPSVNFPGAGFVILQGDTISEVITNVYGLKAVVQVIADLVTPNLIWVGFNMPQVPAYLMTVPTAVVLNNRYLVDSAISETKSGWLLNFSSPIPGNITVSTLISDDFRFVGNLSTHIYVNTTSAVAYTNTSLPAGINLNNLTGGAYTIWTNRTISALRDTHFRWQRTFTYDYYPATDQYRTEISFENTVSIQWQNITLFVPFQNNSKVNNASVRIYDMNNTVFLTEGIHYVLSQTGIHMWFPAWNSSLWRGFTITYTTVNESEYQIPATVTVNQLGDGTTVTMAWGGDSFYYGVATWTNAFREVYDGPLYITLDLTVSIDPNTVVVLGESGLVVTTAVVYGNTIVIPSIHLDVGSKVVFTVLFQSTSAASPMDLTFAGIPVMFVAIAIMISAFIMGVTLTVFQKEERIKQFGRLLIGIAVLAMGFIVIVIIYFIVTA